MRKQIVTGNELWGNESRQGTNHEGTNSQGTNHEGTNCPNTVRALWCCYHISKRDSSFSFWSNSRLARTPGWPRRRHWRPWPRWRWRRTRRRQNRCLRCSWWSCTRRSRQSWWRLFGIGGRLCPPPIAAEQNRPTTKAWRHHWRTGKGRQIWNFRQGSH